jgi:hypothetical protein
VTEAEKKSIAKFKEVRVKGSREKGKREKGKFSRFK